MRRRSPSKKGKKRGRKIPLFFQFLVCVGALLVIILYLHVSQAPSSFSEKARILDQLLRIARDHGTAIGICHPYPCTITTLEEMIPQIKAEGIKIVPLSQAFDEQDNRRP